MNVQEEYEELAGEINTDVIRRYICGGYIPSPGLVLSLLEEIEALRTELFGKPNEQAEG